VLQLGDFHPAHLVDFRRIERDNSVGFFDSAFEHMNPLVLGQPLTDIGSVFDHRARLEIDFQAELFPQPAGRAG
jgi:hypothetical protein